MANQNQYKFTEGEIHTFRINSFSEIPGTDESFFILINPFGGKHLLKANLYKHYNLQINKTIKCKIDKINCSGKIYLEPENPVYKEGYIYDFDLIKIIDHVNSVGKKEKAAVVKDIFGFDIICSLPGDYIIDMKAGKLKCKVLRIKKGELFLSIPELENQATKLKIGKKYCFKVKEIKKLEKNIDHYILKDDFNNSYSLKKDMYEQYEFKIGQTVECIVTKYNSDGYLKIEPVHPYYKIGKTYQFKYLKTIEEVDPLGNKEFVILVKDVYGIETKVRAGLKNFKNDFPEYITCKVEGIRKGKAILSLI